MGTSTREVARRLWSDTLPERDPQALMRELYEAENQGRNQPSGSQDMAGLIYPGVSRLDYDCAYEGGVFPSRVESCYDPVVVAWLERVIHILPVAPRPQDYSPLGERHLDPEWIAKLGWSGKQCFDAIVAQDVGALGASMNECMQCWEALLPATVRHPAISVDLKAILAWYQSQHAGAMYSGCGGGYLYVASEAPVPGAIRPRVRGTASRG